MTAASAVNIVILHLGRSTAGGDAICLVSFDGPMPEPVLAEVLHLPLVVHAVPLRF